MPQWIALQAGPLSMHFDPVWASLRRVRLGARDVLRGIYAPVRDKNWDTIRPRVHNLEAETRGDAFRLRFDVECKEREIDFFWEGTVTGDPAGTVTFSMKGVAHATFLRQRIGFCVLHPIAECEGRPCLIEKSEGTIEPNSFPHFISPHQPFLDVRAISHEVLPGLCAEVRCEGDVFETEDQRNWTDASFKTYCTPLGLPRPVAVAAGTQIDQSVTLTLKGRVPAEARDPRDTGPVVLSVGDTPMGRLPRIGLAMASHGQPIGSGERARLKALKLSHLRVELRLSEPGWRESLARASGEANALGAALEAALFLSAEAENELRQFGKEIERLKPRVAAWLVLPATERATTPPGLVGLARLHLASYDPATPFGGGTARYFTELNRERPPVEELDLVCYSFNPQVHTFDDASITESIEGQTWTARSAQQFTNGLPLAVTPITLKPRSGRPTVPGELPSSADPRQMSPFCAAWTLGSLSALARAGVQSVTYYETTGCLGVMEPDQESPLSDTVPSRPDSVFPVYHVFASLGEFTLGEVILVESADCLRAVGLAVCKDGRMRILLANLTDGSQHVIVRGLRGRFSVRRLGESNADMRLDTGEADPTLSLSTYAVIEIDGAD